MNKLLFVCIENTCRSQMAKAFAKIHGRGPLKHTAAVPEPEAKLMTKTWIPMSFEMSGTL